MIHLLKINIHNSSNKQENGKIQLHNTLCT